MEIGSIHRWQGSSQAPKVFCLHGFLGTGADFEILAEHFQSFSTLIAPNFPDYTQAPSTEKYSWEDCLTTLDAFLGNETGSEEVVLLGYSMGGRIALQYALHYPEKINKLVLVGATPGLSDSQERPARIDQDNAWAHQLENGTLQSFLDDWFNQDLIQTQGTIPEPYRSRMYERRNTNDKASLAAALRCLGTGTMPSGWNQLALLNKPTLLVTGIHDTKFDGIAKEMVKQLPSGTHVSIDKAGHAACFEQPALFGECLHSFIFQEPGR